MEDLEKSTRSYKVGFTITELLITVLVISLLSAAAIISAKGIERVSGEQNAINLVESQLSLAQFVAFKKNKHTAFVIFTDETNPKRHLQECGVAVWEDEQGSGKLRLEKRWCSLPSQYVFDNSNQLKEEKVTKIPVHNPVTGHLGNLENEKVITEIFQKLPVELTQGNSVNAYALFFSPQGQPVAMKTDSKQTGFIPFVETVWFCLFNARVKADFIMPLDSLKIPIGISAETGTVL